MHSFCLSYPYGFVVLLGGLIGFATKGSKASLLAGITSSFFVLKKHFHSFFSGGGSGALLLAIAYSAHQKYLQNQSDSTGEFLKVKEISSTSVISLLSTSFLSWSTQHNMSTEV